MLVKVVCLGDDCCSKICENVNRGSRIIFFLSIIKVKDEEGTGRNDGGSSFG